MTTKKYIYIYILYYISIYYIREKQPPTKAKVFRDQNVDAAITQGQHP